MLGTKNSKWGWSNSGTSCPEMLHDLHPWRYSRPNRIQPGASWPKLSLLWEQQQELNYVTSEVFSNLNYSIIQSLQYERWQQNIVYSHCQSSVFQVKIWLSWLVYRLLWILQQKDSEYSRHHFYVTNVQPFVFWKTVHLAGSRSSRNNPH